MIIIISGAIIADDQSVVVVDHSINTADSAALITADWSVGTLKQSSKDQSVIIKKLIDILMKSHLLQLKKASSLLRGMKKDMT